MIYIDDYTDGFVFLEEAKSYDAEFSLFELRQIVSASGELQMNQCLRELVRNYRYKKESRLSGTFYYKSNMYSHHKEKEELSYAGQMLSLMECGLYDIVKNYEKTKMEKEKAEIEKNKRELRID